MLQESNFIIYYFDLFISLPVEESGAEEASISRPFPPVAKPNPGHASIFSRNHRAASFRNLAAVQDCKICRLLFLQHEEYCN